VNAKERSRGKLIEFLGNPANEWPDRVTLSQKVLGYKSPRHLWKLFSVEELKEIEAEAVELRRKQYAGELAKVDRGLLKKAQQGNARAAKLAYMRFEKWVPAQRVEVGLADELKNMSDEDIEKRLALLREGNSG